MKPFRRPTSKPRKSAASGKPAEEFRIRRGPRPSQQPLPAVIPEELKDASRGVRLQKVLAAAGVASRRDCEELILRGKVTVNGQTVTGLPAWVDPTSDRIEVSGQVITRPAGRGKRAGMGKATGTRKSGPEGFGLKGTSGANPGMIPGGVFHYVILNKPREVISTTDDPAQRRSVLDLVPRGLVPPTARLYPVGRLDADSTGLILLTDDGELAHRITHPSFGVSKTYQVSVRGVVDEATIRRLQDGLYLSKRTVQERTPAIKRVRMDQVRLLAVERGDRNQGERTIVEVTLHEGHNRVIRRMLARLGYKVRRLQRTGIGPVRLKGLARGECRRLTVAEVKALRQAAGLGRDSAKSGAESGR